MPQAPPASIAQALTFQAAAIALAFLAAACNSIPADKLTAFSQGVTAAKTQADTAFTAVNTLASDAIIDYAAKQDSLNEANFFQVLEPSAVANWDQVFSALEKYSQSLIVLASKDINKGYKDATVALASQINATGETLQKDGLIASKPQLSAGVATAFSELGSLIINESATTEAKNIIRRADPAVSRICHGMADLIGANNGQGIRGTVSVHWALLKADNQSDFLKTSKGEPKRRDLAAGFGQALAQQTAQDLTLASLQKSLRALADAHHGLATDSKFDVTAAVAVIKEEATQTKDIYASMKTALAAKQ
jgi:hypothetical protein